MRPKWVLLLLFTVACCLAMLWLGRWQWRAGRKHGDITNYSYAGQWWAFTVFAVIMYFRIVRDYLRKAEQHREPPVRFEATESQYVAYIAPASVPDDDDDPERARFNSYLSSLYAADELAELSVADLDAVDLAPVDLAPVDLGPVGKDVVDLAKVDLDAG